jgi:glycosyltransferase involved in cell wall biosynthesis
VATFDAPTRPGRVIAYERGLMRSLRGADAVLVHMVPEFLVLAAPLARGRRVPLLLWYTHWHASRALRVATRLTDVALSVDHASFPLASPKLRAIGHAIDVDIFKEQPSRDDGSLRFLAVGRTARWKGLATLLDAFARARAEGLEAALEIRGPSLTPDEVAHRAELLARIETDPALRGSATLLDAVPRSEMPQLFASADVVVSPNEPRSGATFDKAVFEAAACARPVVSTNVAFAPLLGELALPLLAPPRDPASLAEVLVSVGGAAPADRAAVGNELRRRVVDQHSLEHWADAIVEVVREVRSARGG